MAKSETIERYAQLIIVLGYTGTGKTTLVKQLVYNDIKLHKSHALIITPDDMEWNSLEDVHPKFPERIRTYVGARRMVYMDGVLKIVAENFTKGMLVLDDCRAYLEAKTVQDLHYLLIRRRQKMFDIVAVSHGFTEVPPKFFTFASKIILFRTIDSIDTRKKYLKDFLQMKAAQERVNKAAEKDPHYFEIIAQV